MKAEHLYEMRLFAEKLSKGIDPTSNKSFTEDTVMNIEKIRRYNEDVCELIDMLLIGINSSGKPRKQKLPFFMFKEAKETFSYSLEPISISGLAEMINQYSMEGMKKINARELTAGLTKLGFLTDVSVDDEKKYKKPTDKGKNLGICEIKKINRYGNEYGVNLYNTDAQKYIIDSLENIIAISKGA